MNRNMNFSLFSTAILLSALAASAPGQAAPKGKPPVARAAQNAQAQPQVFTVRYVVFVATPKKAMTREEVKAAIEDTPPLFARMQRGSADTIMDTTPEGFLNKARGAQSEYSFKRLLSGSVPVINGSAEPAVINAGPDPNDSYTTVLSDSIFLEWNSPTALTLHHTGRFEYTVGTPAAFFRGGPGWDNTHTDKIILGRTYSQGIDNQSDGSMFIYAFCFLPGKLDQTASAWNKQKTVAVVNKNGKGSIR